jgi:hypothetical protein
MRLRPCFERPKVDTSLVASLIALAEKIYDHVDSGRTCPELLGEFNSLAKAECSHDDFHAIHAAVSEEEFVREVLETPRLVANISDDELAEIERRATSDELDIGERMYWYRVLDVNRRRHVIHL